MKKIEFNGTGFVVSEFSRSDDELFAIAAKFLFLVGEDQSQELVFDEPTVFGCSVIRNKNPDYICRIAGLKKGERREVFVGLNEKGFEITLACVASDYLDFRHLNIFQEQMEDEFSQEQDEKAYYHEANFLITRTHGIRYRQFKNCDLKKE